jgi:hypothetical protein
MSATRVAAVPSYFQGSQPAGESQALKKIVPPASVSWAGFELAGPGFTSATSSVVVPSLRHSSQPVAGSHPSK